MSEKKSCMKLKESDAEAIKESVMENEVHFRFDWGEIFVLWQRDVAANQRNVVSGSFQDEGLPH